VRDLGEVEAALRSLTPVRERGRLINSDDLTFPSFAAIAAPARALRLPSGAHRPSYARACSLLGYGPDLDATWLRAVQTADQVRCGQPVGEIAFERPAHITFMLDRTTAEAIGLALPRELLLWADEVTG
jgi:putative tryptophan/tyrosine transport system substrate-binding protein